MTERARVEMHRVVDGLQFPTSLVFDAAGIAYIAESGYVQGRARILRVDLGRGEPAISVLCDDLRAPVNGLTLHEDHLYVAEGGDPGRICRLDRDGRRTVIVDGLPGGGDYHTNMVAIGDDRRIYFGQGAMTNSGVVDANAAVLGPRTGTRPHDLPGLPVVLTGADEVTVEPGGARVTTGAFAAYATAHPIGTRLAPRLPCTAGIMRCALDGSGLEVFAWGLRNPYGLGFLPDGRLLALDLGINDRGVRPVGDAPGCLYVIERGAWYGWPDFVAGVPVDDPRYTPLRGPRPRFLLRHDELPPPPRPLVEFPARAAAVKFVYGRGRLYVALFGDKRPFTAPAGAAEGRSVVCVDLRDRSIVPLAASPMHRPIDLRFHPIDRALYVLDFGDFEVGAGGDLDAVTRSGALWRID